MLRNSRLLIVVLVTLTARASSLSAQAPDEAPPAERAPRVSPAALSVLSGRTLTEGRRAVVAGVGWPGLLVGGYFSPSDAFDVGVRGHLLAGSPFMGFETGFGTELSAPMRLHLFGRGANDLALTVRPLLLLGRASLVRALAPMTNNDFALGVGGEVGLRLGHQLLPKVTLFAGVEGELDHLRVPNLDASDVVGSLTAVLGIEGLLTRATLFFLELEGGYGFAPDGLFESQGIFRATIGFAHTAF